MLSPDGKRFMVLYRWFNGPRKYTRLITCNVDGSDMYLLSDDDMVSHCFWKSDKEILAFERKKDLGCGYYLMKDKTQDYQRLWPFISGDGHPSYSPTDNHTVVTDSYPNRYRISTDTITTPVATATPDGAATENQFALTAFLKGTEGFISLI